MISKRGNGGASDSTAFSNARSRRTCKPCDKVVSLSIAVGDEKLEYAYRCPDGRIILIGLTIGDRVKVKVRQQF